MFFPKCVKNIFDTPHCRITPFVGRADSKSPVLPIKVIKEEQYFLLINIFFILLFLVKDLLQNVELVG